MATSQDENECFGLRLRMESRCLRDRNCSCGIPRHLAGRLSLRRCDFNHARRTEVSPSEFFLTRPNKFHGFACGFGEFRRFNGAFAAVFASIGSASIRHNHANPLIGYPESVRATSVRTPNGRWLPVQTVRSEPFHSARAARGSSGVWAM